MGHLAKAAGPGGAGGGATGAVGHLPPSFLQPPPLPAHPGCRLRRGGGGGGGATAAGGAWAVGGCQRVDGNCPVHAAASVTADGQFHCEFGGVRGIGGGVIGRVGAPSYMRLSCFRACCLLPACRACCRLCSGRCVAATTHARHLTCLPALQPSASGPRQPARPVSDNYPAGGGGQCFDGTARALDPRLGLAHRQPVGQPLLRLGPAAQVREGGRAGRHVAAGACWACLPCLPAGLVCVCGLCVWWPASWHALPLLASTSLPSRPPPTLCAACSWGARPLPAPASCPPPCLPPSPPCCGAGSPPCSGCLPAPGASRGWHDELA